MKESGTPGAVLTVLRGDNTVFRKSVGLADVENGTPVASNMLFQIGSVTKMFTATAVLMLAAEGKIDMQRPVGEMIPGLQPCVARVTPEQLLNHVAGIIDEPAEFGRHEENALSEFVRGWDPRYCIVAPGTGFSYSNPGYALAGLLIEKASGKAYADFMRDSVFEPLGMTRTVIRPTEAITYPIALGYRSDSGHPSIVRPIADDTRFWPAGYIYTNAGDLSKFVMALMNSGKSNGKQAIPAAVVSGLLVTPVNVPTDEQFSNSMYGHGLFAHQYRGVRLFEHVGSMPGYSAHVWFVPESRAAVLLMATNEQARFPRTLNAALESIVELSSADTPKQPNNLELSPEEAAHVAGKYANRWTFELKVKDGQLFLENFGLEVQAYKIGERRFLVKPPWAPDGAVMLLGPDQNGKPEYLQIYLWIFRRADV